MRRHYHVEDTDGTQTPAITSFRAAISEGRKMVDHARHTGLWESWAVDWHDSSAGYHRWEGLTMPEVGEFTDTITVIPCRQQHEEVS